MKTFLNIRNRYFFGAIFIVWLLSLFFAKFAVVWNTTQDEIFRIPEAIMNSLFLLWLIQKTIKTSKNLVIFGCLALFWFMFTIRILKFLVNYSF